MKPLTSNKIGVIPIFTILLGSLIIISSQSSPAFAATYGINIPAGTSVPECEKTNSCFYPYEQTIDAGDEIIWFNDDSAAHTVTSGTAKDGADGNFDSGLFMPFTKYTFVFNEPGNYPYFCMVHPWMTGEVIVEGSSSSSSTSSGTTKPPPAPSGTDVTIPLGSSVPSGSNYFSPQAIAIYEHDNILWYNGDTAVHTITSGTSSGGPDGNFDSGLIMSGTTFSHTFNESGNYDYFCMIHPWMTGKVVVKNVAPPPTSVPKSSPPTVSSSPSYTDITILPGTSAPTCGETNTCYQPFGITTKVGNSITWFNQDSAAHTVTSGNAVDGPDGNFDSGLFMAGTTFSHRFDREGTYPYFCMVHPWMTGDVVVSGTSDTNTSTTSKDYPSTYSPVLHDPSKIHSIQISGTKFSVDYRTSSGQIIRGFADNLANSITFQISTGSEGQLTITLPRELIDAKIGTRDNTFLVLVDGEKNDYNEIPNSVERKLTIPFKDSAEEIEIIGTKIAANPPTVTQQTKNVDESPFTASALPAFDVSIATGTSVQGCEKTSTCYDPVWKFAKVGDVVTWYNSDSASHTVTSGTAKNGPDGIMDSGLIKPGDTFSYKVADTGDLVYFCYIHPWMTGQVIVEAPPADISQGSDVPPTLDEFIAYLPNVVINHSPVLKFKVVYVNSIDEKCTEQNYKDIHFYKEVTRNYLSWYGIEAVSATPQCVTVNDFNKASDTIISEEIELLILMTDHELSQEHLINHREVWGYYWPAGDMHLIVSNTFSRYWNNDAAAFTLSHELSHFALHYTNQPWSVWVDWVHNIQDQVNQCQADANEFDNLLYGGDDYHYGSIQNCPPSLYLSMYADGKIVRVMQPYGEEGNLQYDSRTELTLASFPLKVNEGQKITFNGVLNTKDGHPVGYAKISIKDEDTGTHDDVLVSTKTDQYGRFSVDWTVKNTDFWDNSVEIFAVFEGDGYVQQSRSTIQPIYVNES